MAQRSQCLLRNVVAQAGSHIYRRRSTQKFLPHRDRKRTVVVCLELQGVGLQDPRHRLSADLFHHRKVVDGQERLAPGLKRSLLTKRFVDPIEHAKSVLVETCPNMKTMLLGPMMTGPAIPADGALAAEPPPHLIDCYFVERTIGIVLGELERRRESTDTPTQNCYLKRAHRRLSVIAPPDLHCIAVAVESVTSSRTK